MYRFSKGMFAGGEKLNINDERGIWFYHFSYYEIRLLLPDEDAQQEQSFPQLVVFSLLSALLH